MRDMLSDPFDRGLSGLAFQPLPWTGHLLLIAGQQMGHGHALDIVQRVIGLLVIWFRRKFSREVDVR
jgi:hypothetical protein